jgi:hypothetical protein
MAKTFSELIGKIRTRLQDTQGDFWSDDELLLALNEGQRDYAERTKCLTALAPIIAKENIETYNFPDDYLDFIRMENADGEAVTPTVSPRVQELFGDRWRDATGDPQYLFSDLDGAGQFRMYPRPVPSADVEPNEFSPYLLQEINSPIMGSMIYGMLKDHDYSFVIDDNHIYVFLGEPFAENLIKKIAHGIVLTGKVEMCLVGKVSPSYYSEQTIVWTHDKDIYKTLIFTGTTSLFGTCVKTINHLVGVIGRHSSGDNDMIIGYVNDSGFYYTFSDVFSEVLSKAGSYTAYQSYTRVLYSGTACGSEGIILGRAVSESLIAFYNTSNPLYDGSTAVVGISAIEKALNLTDDITAYVLLDNGDVYNYTNDELVVNLGNTYENFLIYQNDKLYYAATSTGNFLASYDLSSGEQIAYYPVLPLPFSTTFSDLPLPYTAFAIGNVFFWSWASGRIWSTDNEPGAIVYADGVSFEDELGALVDVESGDETELVVFETDEGGVSAVVDDAEAMLLWYHRWPRDGENLSDTADIPNDNALMYYALWQAYMKDDSTSSPQKAAYYKGMYETEIGRAVGRRQRGYVNTGEARPKAYYF